MNILKDKETDYCYNCGHQLGQHRMSGRCDYCNCQQYEIKPPESYLRNATIYDQLYLKDPENADLLYFNIRVSDIQCSECNKYIFGNIVIKKEGLTVADTSTFMMFSDKGIVCNDCVDKWESK